MVGFRESREESPGDTGVGNARIGLQTFSSIRNFGTWNMVKVNRELLSRILADDHPSRIILRLWLL